MKLKFVNNIKINHNRPQSDLTIGEGEKYFQFFKKSWNDKFRYKNLYEVTYFDKSNEIEKYIGLVKIGYGGIGDVKEKLYTDKFSKKNSNVRKYYDEILLLSKNNICPYCLSRQVRSLDHFLPKSLYPSLSITDINLLPSCSDCNKDKSNSDEIYINYYFEDIDDECYLSCHPIFKEKDVIFDYRLDKPSTWDNDKFQRLSTQFNKTNLLKYYAEQAQIEFSRKQRSFIRLAHQPSSLENELKDLVSDEESVLGINSLQSALWRGLVLNVKELNSFLLKQELG